MRRKGREVRKTCGRVRSVRREERREERRARRPEAFSMIALRTQGVSITSDAMPISGNSSSRCITTYQWLQ